MSEDTAMHAPSWIARNFNVPTVVLLLGVLVSQVSFQVNTGRDIQDIKDYRVDRAKQTDDRFDQLNDQIKALNDQNIPYRVTVNEQQITAVNKRVDDITAAVFSGFDAIRKDIGTVGTKVEVLSSKIDSLAPRSNRTQFTVPDRATVFRAHAER